MVSHVLEPLGGDKLKSHWAAFPAAILIGLLLSALAVSSAKQLILALLVAALAAVFLVRMPEVALAMFLVIGVLKGEPTISLLFRGVDLTLYLAFIVWAAIAYRLWVGKTADYSASLLVLTVSFICLMLISLVQAENPGYGLDKAGRFILLTSLGLVAPSFILSQEKAFERFAKTLVLVGLFISLMTIRQWFISPA